MATVGYEYSAEEPLNREPPVEDLVSSFFTESDGYDRNHGPIPHIDASEHIVRVDGAVENILELSVDQLHKDFEQHEVTPCQEESWYGGSIELERAMREDADVVLALEMNGNSLSPNHGYPVRVVAPGIAGARSVKWLDCITVQLRESANFYQQHDYKVLPPEAVDGESAKQYWHTVPAIQDMPVNSVVAVPKSGDTVAVSPDGTIPVKGYALPSGENGPVTKVEVSSDEGKTWNEADLISHPEDCENTKWAWILWRAAVKVEPGHPRYALDDIGPLA
ncbi:hypothetical protein B0A49_04566 [Cryomyces minteri]|uniref:Sulfite oxidase n=1 Tax=Cryomyces minteri TaxID=331657 RepID=A0A4U0WYX1_9PEZI|nr:hypothetical protein B0A49_04566 [Cryomyces minteri]